MFWKKKPLPAVPHGQRIYAIGDIHGMLDLLDRLLAIVVADDAERSPVERRTLIFLGDYIDRGPESRGVVDRMLTGMPAGFEVIHLKGNHEEILLRCLVDPGAVPPWLANGGLQTLASYGVIEKDVHGVQPRPSVISPALARALPQEHRAFYGGLPLSVTFGDYFFVHAGVRPGTPLDRQAERDCLYIREPFLSHKRSFGKVVVHGHTPTPEPELRTNRIGIDTGGVFWGRMCALRLEGVEQGFVAT